jgi:hypothetical protein
MFVSDKHTCLSKMFDKFGQGQTFLLVPSGLVPRTNKARELVSDEHTSLLKKAAYNV